MAPFGCWLRGVAIFSTLNSRLLHRSFLMRLLQTTGLSLALMTASAAGVHAEDVTVQGSAGVDGTDGVNPDDPGQPGGDAGGATASAGSADPVNEATTIGGNGGRGGTDGFDWNDFHGGDGPSGAKGGRGGDASAGATTTITSGPAEADATSSGGSGGYGGGVDEAPDQGGGDGGFATGTATASTGSGSATASAVANGGSGGGSDLNGGVGGGASASSTATTAGSGDASSSASATGDAAGYSEFPTFLPSPGNATATATASATGGGKAIATAFAAAGFPNNFGGFVPPPTGTAVATSTAQTTNGAMAKALSTINPSTDEAAGTSEATAKTSFGGVSVQSDVTNTIFPDFVTVEAIAQGGWGQTSLDLGAFGAISTARPDKAYATTLIAGASNVAEALLGPRDEIFGTAILELPWKLHIRFQFSRRSAAWRDRRFCRRHCRRRRNFQRRSWRRYRHQFGFLRTQHRSNDLRGWYLCHRRRGSRGLNLGDDAVGLRRARACWLSANARGQAAGGMKPLKPGAGVKSRGGRCAHNALSKSCLEQWGNQLTPPPCHARASGHPARP